MPSFGLVGLGAASGGASEVALLLLRPFRWASSRATGSHWHAEVGLELAVRMRSGARSRRCRPRAGGCAIRCYGRVAGTSIRWRSRRRDRGRDRDEDENVREPPSGSGARAGGVAVAAPVKVGTQRRPGAHVRGSLAGRSTGRARRPRCVDRPVEARPSRHGGDGSGSEFTNLSRTSTPA